MLAKERGADMSKDKKSVFALAKFLGMVLTKDPPLPEQYTLYSGPHGEGKAILYIGEGMATWNYAHGVLMGISIERDNRMVLV